jgi:hypothetical protein
VSLWLSARGDVGCSSGSLKSLGEFHIPSLATKAIIFYCGVIELCEILMIDSHYLTLYLWISILDWRYGWNSVAEDHRGWFGFKQVGQVDNT